MGEQKEKQAEEKKEKLSLVQVKVPADVRAAADAAFARNGLTTNMAMRMMLYQIAKSGKTPLDDVWVSSEAREMAQAAVRGRKEVV